MLLEMNETGNIPIIAPRVDSLTSEEEAGKVAFTNWGPKQTTHGTELPPLLFDGSFVYCLLLYSPCLYLIINLIMIVCFIPITLLACRTHYYTIKLLLLLTPRQSTTGQYIVSVFRVVVLSPATARRVQETGGSSRLQIVLST